MIDLDEFEGQIRGAYDLCHVRADDVLSLIEEVRRLRVMASANQGAIVNSIIERTRPGATELGDEDRGAADRLSLLLWNLTGGRLSKSNYSVRTMELAIEETLKGEWESQNQEKGRRAQRLEAAIREALRYKAVLPPIATTPRKILEDAL